MEISGIEREKIYLEEKAKREPEKPCCSGGHSGSLILFNLLALAGIAGLFYLTNSAPRRKLTVEDMRKAYDGLSPDEML